MKHVEQVTLDGKRMLTVNVVGEPDYIKEHLEEVFDRIKTAMLKRVEEE